MIMVINFYFYFSWFIFHTNNNKNNDKKSVNFNTISTTFQIKKKDIKSRFLSAARQTKVSITQVSTKTNKQPKQQKHKLT